MRITGFVKWEYKTCLHTHGQAVDFSGRLFRNIFARPDSRMFRTYLFFIRNNISGHRKCWPEIFYTALRCYTAMDEARFLTNGMSESRRRFFYAGIPGCVNVRDSIPESLVCGLCEAGEARLWSPAEPGSPSLDRTPFDDLALIRLAGMTSGAVRPSGRSGSDLADRVQKWTCAFRYI